MLVYPPPPYLELESDPNNATGPWFQHFAFFCQTFHQFTWRTSYFAVDQFVSCTFGPKHWSEDEDRGQEQFSQLFCVFWV
ncbi:hypothetical protein PAMP_008840 [Pampus punctatissimus]